jgi:hypothetical protein
VQSTGDGIFALFGAPVAYEDHPQRALYAALRMQEEIAPLFREAPRDWEPADRGVTVRGVSKSTVSERFVYGTERKLAELMSRDLRKFHVVALLLDGVHLGEHVVLAAVGVDAHGDKHVLGLREGATENAAAVRALLADLVERGIATDRSLLIVIDGAKALHKAVAEVFGAHALIQRCREHSVPGRAHSKEVRSPLTGKTFEPVSLGQVVAA